MVSNITETETQREISKFVRLDEVRGKSQFDVWNNFKFLIAIVEKFPLKIRSYGSLREDFLFQYRRYKTKYDIFCEHLSTRQWSQGGLI